MSNSHLVAVRLNETIKGPARAVLMVLADRADENGNCYPGMAKIAKESGFCRSTVKTALRSLKNDGWISWVQRFNDDGDLTSNLYHLALGRAGDDPPRAGDGLGVGQELAEGRAGAGHKASIKASIEASLFDDENSPMAESNPSRNGNELFDHWNTFEELPKILKVSKERKSKLKARLGDEFFRENWKAAIDKIRQSPFLTGTNDRGWKADIDWLLKPGNILKVIEGKYDAPPPSQTQSVPPGAVTINGRVFKS